MELKDVILSTLAEMEEVPAKPTPKYEVKETLAVKKVKIEEVKPEVNQAVSQDSIVDENSCESEVKYLNSIKERLLVLFEGFQAPNNTNIEAKIDMTLNFLEYTLATIDSRINILEKGKR
ncbi:MAG: hypothetical protein ACI9TV_001932 [Sulfurimonas sp.]|jgi:hypothetical protein|uniref:CiaD-like domain-containing protein n=1 Tax=Sulfurimonas sp. TaxID=2022749 RepID=UPI0039E4D655